MTSAHSIIRNLSVIAPEYNFEGAEHACSVHEQQLEKFVIMGGDPDMTILAIYEDSFHESFLIND